MSAYHSLTPQRDFSSKSEDVIGQIKAIVHKCLQKTGFFHSGPPPSRALLEGYATVYHHFQY